MAKPSLVTNARKYLLSVPGVDEAMLDAHLQNWRDNKKSTKPELFKALIKHAQNRQSMPNTIGGVDKLADVLFDFAPNKVFKAYPDHLHLLEEIIRKKIKTPSAIDPSNIRSHWVIFAKSIISSAKFLHSFKNAAEFHAFVNSFYGSAHSRLALPLLLKEEIHGFGFALACDFLKESGYNGFIKPDTHINDICRAAGVTSAESDYGVFKDVISYCEKHDQVPYEFDKLLWLVGSGTFYLNQHRVKTSKHQFLAEYGYTRTEEKHKS